MKGKKALAGLIGVLNSIEGNGWEVNEDGITRIVPASGLNLIVGNQTIVIDDEGIGTGKLDSTKINHAGIVLLGSVLSKEKYDILIEGDKIFINIKTDVMDLSCEHGVVPIEGTGILFTKGGTWEGSALGRACLDDNGIGPVVIYVMKW